MSRDKTKIFLEISFALILVIALSSHAFIYQALAIQWLKIFQETRQWQIASDAQTLTIRPTTDDTVTWGAYPGTGEDNAEDVNEETKDDDDTYVFASSGNEQDEYVMEDSGNPGGTISNVTVYVYARQTTGDENLRVGVVSYDDPDYTIVSPATGATYQLYSHSMDNEPTGGLPWEWSDVDALTAYIRSANVGRYDGEIRVTQYYIVVTYSVAANNPPTINEVSLNSKGAINLIEGTQIDIMASVSVTDTNGCSDISGVKAIIYRYSTYTASCSMDYNNCYDEDIASCSYQSCSVNTATYECTASSSMYFFADPTDDGSSFSADEWVVSIIASDSVWNDTVSNSYDDNDESDIEVNTLTALEVTAGDPIQYNDGNPVFVGQNTGSTNETVTVKNTGNRGIDVNLSGTNLTGACGTITVDNQQYASTSFTYDDYGTDLTGSPVRYEGGSISWAKPNSASPVTNDIYWGIGVPVGTGPGACSGTNTFTATAEQ